jgi:hypothetical protein
LFSDTGATALVRPTFTLEHFEHSVLVWRERISLDLLKAHCLKPTLSRGRIL